MATRKAAKRGSRKSRGPSAQFMEKLKQFVRTQGVDFLRDQNISSVGIGYKRKDGKPTNEISIQFTVARKAAPEVLESLGTTEIPKTLVVDGVEVPTDVIQRTYEPAMKIVATEASGIPRKSRIDPIVPGVSVANTKVTAGTIGSIVFDRQDGTPYILSNWHVLHGPQGLIGDTIVQPGPHDDNRISLNRVGKLIRSHLGAAGDCAIASIEDRSFEESILELGVKIEQLGEPELGDKLIKSGRTTGVTHGIVTRVHTIAKIDYGGTVGEQSVGGFEIGPDEDNLPGDGEISMGGDSGAAWLLKASNGKPTKVMGGLHFAGEGAGDPNEHAVACYAKSVFEKLEITVTPPKEEATVSRGYAPNFIGPIVKVPKLSSANSNDALKLNDSVVIPYTHFSLALSKSRRFAFWVAWNIDGGRLKSLSRKGLKFDFDLRIPTALQVGDDLYAGNRLDRGHVARRADLLWGSEAEARDANKDSFFFTNITPQMDNFNQSSLSGIWGRLENAVFEEVDVDNLRVSVFGGPVFRSDDRVFRGVKIPREFFKVLAFVEASKLKARAFLLTQNLNQLEVLDLNQFKVFQVKLSEVEQRCGFAFPAKLKAADGFAEHLESLPEAVAAEREPLRSLDDISW
ncbi:MAG: DNA/RNA non-specific endonuclease [Acidobacteriota bacterium]